MKSSTSLALLFVLFCAGGTALAEPDERSAREQKIIVDAKAAAAAWLALTDRGQYARSWQNAAPLFRRAVSREDWIRALEEVREPLGVLRRRAVKSAEYTRQVPGAPQGEYVVIEFESAFEHEPAATETVTPTRVGEGVWQVSGYFIRPSDTPVAPTGSR